MPRFLNTLGKSTVAIAICDRCKMKRPHADLVCDGDNPALMVCKGCRDDADPYRFAPREPEDITLRFVRGDVDLT